VAVWTRRFSEIVLSSQPNEAACHDRVSIVYPVESVHSSSEQIDCSIVYDSQPDSPILSDQSNQLTENERLDQAIVEEAAHSGHQPWMWEQEIARGFPSTVDAKDIDVNAVPDRKDLFNEPIEQEITTLPTNAPQIEFQESATLPTNTQSIETAYDRYKPYPSRVRKSVSLRLKRAGMR
jgi:hypothetical protein